MGEITQRNWGIWRNYLWKFSLLALLAALDARLINRVAVGCYCQKYGYLSEESVGNKIG